MSYQALASDYDGTLAHDGHVREPTLAAVRRLKASGRKFILVTGRELPELESVFPNIALCDVVVAENGALLYWPAEKREEILAEPPTDAFISEMNRLEVRPFSVGRVIFATWRPHETVILEAIQRLGVGYQIIFNKKAVMVLPAQVNKATGLAAALHRLDLAPEQVVAVGDAENDHAFLDACGVSAAVSNALPAVQAKCDIVTQRDHGDGVVELIDMLLADGLARLGERKPRDRMVERQIEHSG